jgi:hypothetical protein
MTSSQSATYRPPRYITPAQIKLQFPDDGPSEKWIEREARKYGITKTIAGRVYVLANFIEVLARGGVPAGGKYELAPPDLPGMTSSPIGWVYFIRSPCARFVKIGFTENVAKRLKRLQVAHYGPLELVFAMHGGEQEEKELHERFHTLRSYGEWFRWGPEIAAFIREMRAA